VLLFGIAGSYSGSGLEVGQLALASLEIQADLGLRQGGLQAMGFPALTLAGQPYFNHFPLDRTFTQQLAQQLALTPQPFLTRDLVAETPQEAQDLERQWGAVLENMEGAAAAQVGLALGLPVAELRSISNPAGVRDRAQWNFGLALGALERAVLSLITPA
jgi:futalosine hydrolase